MWITGSRLWLVCTRFLWNLNSFVLAVLQLEMCILYSCNFRQMLTIVVETGNWKHPNLNKYKIIGVFKVVNTNAAFFVSDKEFLSACLIYFLSASVFLEVTFVLYLIYWLLYYVLTVIFVILFILRYRAWNGWYLYYCHSVRRSIYFCRDWKYFIAMNSFYKKINS